MRFGPVPVEAAVGLVAAHGVRLGEVAIRKGQVVSAEDAARLRQAGVATLVVAALDPGDVGEDEAAHRLARAAAGANVRVELPFTGRSNLFAACAGVLVVERAGVDALNAVDEAITFATLPASKPVRDGEMVATVKIIPYAVAGASLDGALALAEQGLVGVALYRRRRVAVISTLTSALKASVVSKTLRVLADRLAPAGAAITREATVPHDAAALARALEEAAESDLVVVFGASAIADRRDVIPAALEGAGGRVEHLGMPVDPGNLLMVGDLAGLPVIGAPGCARSPAENGFDWVLHRLLADLPVTRADIVGLGVGGLLMEIVSRPQPRGGGGEG